MADVCRGFSRGDAYYRASLIITTNLLFETWTELLGSKRLTSALLDRLTQIVHILAVTEKATAWRGPNGA